jgi:putative transposase
MIKCLLHLKKPKNIIKLQEKPCDPGHYVGRLNLKQLLVVTDDTKLCAQKTEKITENHTFTQEFHQKNKMQICNSKLNICQKNIPNTKLCQTLDLASTQTGKGLKPFWTKSCPALSEKLWLPTEIGCQDLALNLSHRFVKNLELKLKYLEMNQNLKPPQKNLLKISCPLSQFSPPDIMDPVNITYSRKIRIYPNSEQKKLFNKCFDVSRFIYNKGVEVINKTYQDQLNNYKKQNENGCITCKAKTENNFFCDKHKKQKLKWKLPLTLPTLRPMVMKSDKDLTENELWQKEVPYDTRQLVLKSLITNYKSAISNKRSGNIKEFKFKFKRKDNPQQIMFVCKKAMIGGCIFKRRLKKKSKILFEKRHDIYSNYTPKHDFSIIKEHNKFYVIYSKERISSYKNAKYDVCSLDPGVRSFQTYYSPEKCCGSIGDNVNNKLTTMNNKLDKLSSIINSVSGRTKHNIKKRCLSLRTKMKSFVRDLHWQTCSFLTKNFGTIIIPEFKSKNMVKKDKTRKIGKRTVREMLGLSHFSFLQKLKFKCSEYNRKLIITTEEYTSKTCGNCGELNQKLGSSKVFHCRKCNLHIDRDLNGARNILIKYLLKKSLN